MNHNITAIKKQDLSYFSPSEIQPAAENRLLYDTFAPNADEDDYKLYMSIEKEGIREPLHVSREMGFTNLSTRNREESEEIIFKIILTLKNSVLGLSRVCQRIAKNWHAMHLLIGSPE